MTKMGADDFIQRTGATAEELDHLPRVDLSPTLAPEVLQGLAGRIIETIDPYTEADPVATLAHLLTGAGNLIGPTPHARVQHDEHPLRLYVGLGRAHVEGPQGNELEHRQRALQGVQKP